ncbi:MAG: hypothetical protein E7337_15980 [Clostridiales bacterium]|nr:hypothetical protein [Clostridiales bacterium]
MDKNVKCGVIRDLLPLVVDEVATEDSVELVKAHMETCEACRGYHEGMTMALARTNAPKPETDNAFLRLGKKIKFQTNMRKWLTMALAAVLAFVIIVSGYVFVDRKVSIYNVDMDPDWADVQLYYEINGEVAARISMRDGHGWYNCLQSLYTDGIVYLIPQRPEWTFLNKGNTGSENTFLFNLYWQDGKVVEKRSDYEDYYDPEKGRWVSEDKEIIRPVRAIRWGTMENYNTLYMEGEELPSYLEVLEGDKSQLTIKDPTEIKESDTPDQTIIVQEDAPAEADGETLRDAAPEDPAPEDPA